MTDSLGAQIDQAVSDLLSLSGDLRAKDVDGKPAITPKELTEAIRVASEWWDKKRGAGQEAWGSALKKAAG